ncbi:MAG: phospholipid carrier-dependent glycosyltransferase [Anaerolineae bacterium]|nr:phospholipid carrier-dependent glycosyltransferase [Anaerolineae bacterium]
MNSEPKTQSPKTEHRAPSTEHPRFRLPRWVDVVFVAALALYVLIGAPGVTFHGDEAMQIYMSADYATVFLEGNAASLSTPGQYNIDSDAQLRILNGSVNRHTIGFAWYAAGYTRADLPPAPGWDWGLSYDDNVATGHRPTEHQLAIARLPSALLLAGSIAVMFALAQIVGGRALAYGATALYTLNPIVLVNGRRAMQEGAMLFFGLLAVYAACLIVSRMRSRSTGPARPALRLTNGGFWRWALLALACGLTLASKHSGIVFVAGAFGWVFVGGLVRAFDTRRDGRSFLGNAGALILKTAVAGLLALGLTIALMPALWQDPAARFDDLLRIRADLIDIQVMADPNAPMSLEQRVNAILTQPFMTPVAHFEATLFDVPPMQAEIAAYMASPLSGVQFDVAGIVLELLSLIGVVALIVRLLRPGRDRALAVGLLIWLAVIVASLLANPLPWQRYYLALIPVASLLAMLGALWLLRLVGVNVYAEAGGSVAE